MLSHMSQHSNLTTVLTHDFLHKYIFSTNVTQCYSILSPNNLEKAMITYYCFGAFLCKIVIS